LNILAQRSKIVNKNDQNYILYNCCSDKKQIRDLHSKRTRGKNSFLQLFIILSECFLGRTGLIILDITFKENISSKSYQHFQHSFEHSVFVELTMLETNNVEK